MTTDIKPVPGKQPVIVWDGRQVRCCYCRTDDWALPDGPRLAEGHVGTRFRDNGFFRVLLDGEDVTNRTVEAMGGRHGWVALQMVGKNGDKVVCVPGGRYHILTEKTFGHVVVERVVPGLAR